MGINLYSVWELDEKFKAFKTVISSIRRKKMKPKPKIWKKALKTTGIFRRKKFE